MTKRRSVHIICTDLLSPSVELHVLLPLGLADGAAVAVHQSIHGLPVRKGTGTRAVQHQNAEPCIKQVLGEAGVPRAAPGIKAQPPHSHSFVLCLIRAFGLNEDGLRTALVLRQIGQQLRAQPCSTVFRQHGKVIQLAHPAACRAHHEQVRRQCFAVEHAPCVGGAVRFAVQDHAQGL